MLAKGSVKKPYTVAVCVIAVIILGVISFMSSTTDLLPSMNLPYIVVYTTCVGASPERVETNITRPLEAALASISNLENISSTSSENVSMVMLEMSTDADMDSAMIELSAKIDQTAPLLDSSAEVPVAMKINPDILPVMVAAVDMQGMDIVELSDYVDGTLIGKLEGINGVASVSASGLIEEEVTVSIDQELIDKVNTVILEEVDKELAKVEKKLKDGEKKLNEGKAKLDKEGKAGLRQIDEGINKLKEARAQLPAMIAGAKAQRAELTEKLSQATAAVDSLDQALKSLEGQGLSDSQKKRLSELRGEIKWREEQIEADKRLIEKLKNPDATPQPTAAPTPKPSNVKRVDEFIDISKKKKKKAALFTAYAAELGPNDEEIARLEKEIARLEKEISEIESSGEYAGLLAREAVSAQISALGEQKKQAEAGVKTINDGIASLDGAIKKLENGVIPAGFAQGVTEDTDIEKQIAYLEKTREDTQKKLDKARKELNKAQKELGEARKEFEEKREEAFKDAKLDGVITLEMIGGIIAAQNLSMPAGYLTQEGRDYLVRVGDEFNDISELSETVLFTMDLKTLKEVRLKDVATVEFTNNADKVYSKINGNDGIILSFTKQSTYSTAEVAKDIRGKFAELQNQTPGLRLTALVDQGIYVDMIINSVLSNLVYGAVLAILVLLLFLGDYRPTLVIALSIPISVVVAFVAMYFSKITLNVMSLAGLALGVGMLVDNSIVVIENIYRLRGEGRPVLDSCIEGTSQMTGAISSSTLTTICVFLPLLFITGLARMLFGDMGLTITYSLLASLLVAMTLVPAMSSALLKNYKPKTKKSLFERMTGGYAKMLGFTLRHKAPLILLGVALLAFTGYTALTMGITFIPDVDSNQMTASLVIPTDYTFDEEVELSNKVLDALLTVDDVDTIGVFSSGNASMAIAASGASDAMNYYITLKDGKKHKNAEIARLMAAAAEPLNCEITFKTSNMDISTLSGSGISVDVKGSDIDTLREIATDISHVIETIPGAISVSDGQEDTTPEFTLRVDKRKAIEDGLTVAQIYQFVASTVSQGAKVATLSSSSKEYAIIALDGKNSDITIDELTDRTIEVEKADETIQVRLGDVCDISLSQSLSTIGRINQQHVVTASFDADSEHNITLLGRELEKKLAGYKLPDGYSVSISGESDTINSAIFDLIKMIALAVVLIYLIMVAQFQSFLMPFIVLFTIPLALTGGLLALIVTGTEISVVSMLGFLILAGVIVNNGIVFVDSVNQMRLEGAEKGAALIETGKIRLRPILMTALTTILGMSTMALGRDMGSEMLMPLALVTIGGLTYGTFLTLFIIPSLYDIFVKTGKKSRREKRAKYVRPAPAAPAAPTDEDEEAMNILSLVEKEIDQKESPLEEYEEN